MRIGEVCEKCLYDRQEEITRGFDENKRKEYLMRVRETIENRDEDDSAPYMVYLFHKIYREYFGEPKAYAEINRTYNALAMTVADDIEYQIEKSGDPLRKSLEYARIGNYIDFGAMQTVEADKLMDMLNDKNMQGMDEVIYNQFIHECESAKEFLLICDNSGEIVLDKLFVKQLKKRFPNMNIKAMVRGGETLNDATMADALYSGMTEEIPVFGNGNLVAGTVPKLLDDNARKLFDNADVILAKGQGNYETLLGCGKNIYYSFLCKCKVFTAKFNVPRLTGLFIREINA